MTLLFLGLYSGYVQAQNDQLEKVRVGLPSIGYPEFLALIHLAQEQGFFTDVGLDISFQFVPSGVEALKELHNGNVDIASAAEFPFVSQNLKGSDMKILASVAELDILEVIAREDRGILKPADLKGKRMTMKFGTQGNFLLDRFLLSYGISLRELELIEIQRSEERMRLLVEGTVDAVIHYGAEARQIKEALGDNWVSWSLHRRPSFWQLIIGRAQFLQQHPKLVERFLRALQEAEVFYLSNPISAIDLLTKHTDLDKQLLESFLSKTEYKLSLEKTLLIALEDEARWLIENQYSDAKEVPNFLEFIYFNALEAVKPDGVDIVH